MTWTLERKLYIETSGAQSELELRMHDDLVALEALSRELPDRVGARVVVEKGYAVDASCTGYLTRPHYDTDILVVIPTNQSTENLQQNMAESLALATNFEWVATQQKRASWIKFHEQGKRQWDEGITDTDRDYELAHQMDVHIVCSSDPFAAADYVELSSRDGASYTKPLIDRHLYDSYGNQFSITTPTVDDMLATKLRLISSFEYFYGHGLRESDYYDFQLLLSSDALNPDSFIELLGGYYAKQGITHSEVQQLICRELRPVAHLAPRSVLSALGMV